MTLSAMQRGLGIGAVLVAALLILWAIPTFVSTPSNVGNVILSPLFWPYSIAGLTGLVGLGLVASTFRADGPDDSLPANEPIDDPIPGLIRLAGIAVIMVLTMVLIDRIGMVWASMLAFAATAFLVRTRHPRLALVSAVAVPLVLYVFFAHVAGVAVPQGELVRLP
ncbi:MAG: tripartite tricarboxylate transporter TctB family protein [Pseudomonadota bacterium]